MSKSSKNKPAETTQAETVNDTAAETQAEKPAETVDIKLTPATKITVASVFGKIAMSQIPPLFIGSAENPEPNPNKELAICEPNAKESNKIITALYLPNVIIAGTEKTSNLPFLKDRFIAGKNNYYVCQNKTCQLPNTSIQEVINQLSLK